MRRAAEAERLGVPGRRWVTAVATVYVLGLALAAVITSGAVDRVDDRTTAAVGSWVASHPVVGEVAAILTWMGSPPVLVAIVLGAAAWLKVGGDRRSAVTLVLVGGLGALVETALKVTIARPRPDLQALVTARGYSFPSGHAMNSMIVLVATAWLLASSPMQPGHGTPQARRRAGIAVGAAAGLAVAIGVSRVVLGVHHPGDVVAGWALAAVWLAITLAEGRPRLVAQPLAAWKRLADRTHGEPDHHQGEAPRDGG